MAELKREVENTTTAVGDVNLSLGIDRKTRPKISEDIDDLFKSITTLTH